MSDDPRSEHPEQLLDEHEVARMLKRSVKTLRNDRSLGRGPRYVRVGRSVRYRLEDVRAYLSSRIGGSGAAVVFLMEFLRSYD